MSNPPKYVEPEVTDLYKEIDGHAYRLVYREETSRFEWEHFEIFLTAQVALVNGQFRVVEMMGPIPQDNCMERMPK